MISTGTIIRTLVLVAALVNQVLTTLGKSPLPFTSEAVEQGLSAAFTALVALWALWKNNSFTKAAIEGDKVMNKLKRG